MEEIEKYTKLWNLPQGYGNPWNKKNPYWDEIALFIVRVMVDRGFDLEDSVLDIGGGAGGFKVKLPPECEYTSLDIAPNSGADMVGDISNAYEIGYEIEHGFFALPRFDWALAIDMLEHLPTERVQPALLNIREISSNGVFLISTRADRGGKKIGTTLHMTVRPPAWWHRELREHWDNVETLRIVEGEYCIIAVTG